MKHLSIKWSLSAALAALVVMIGLISALGFYSSASSDSALDELALTNGQLTNLANRTQVNALRAHAFLDRFASLSAQGNPDLGAENQQRAVEAVALADDAYTAFRNIPLPADDTRQPLVEAIGEAYLAYVTNGIVPMLDAMPFQIQRQQEALAELGGELDAAMEDLLHYTNARSVAEIARIQQLSSWINGGGIALLLIALVAAFIIRALMIRGVVAPIREAITHFERIAEGDLTASIKARGRNEIGQLFAALSAMQARLKQLVLALRESSDGVFSGASDISSGSQDLSSRTEQQASALQQTAASMEEMATTVSRNTEIAQQADTLSLSAARSVESGGAEVERTAIVMREIAESAKRINDIIGVIDSIAFQTNILALNASVEAARAGEQGRGFAVVASEVRSLASRSAASASEIRALIETTTQQIDSGAAQAEHSGTTIASTVASIQQVTALMAEISTATREQNGGIAQINAALAEMDGVTQQNAALVQQTSTAANALEHQARHLAEQIGMFRLSGNALALADAS